LSETEGVKDVKISYAEAKAWIVVVNSIENKTVIDAVSNVGPYKGKIIDRQPIE
jgi:hypothetical protein